ncbi:hypothetical protein M409DRAFT_65809 [Zasmidium cellare ATCC 36951]|uniref:Glutamyl-tRNA(Gln) amidotransferase subunit A, mitochondrial n=1 Tax=Zasmidium cellare ATCC 36951 TaxID=1080233 RepID=A0A6A6CKC3_ZASCE|nr:uncharacterized protein M409DRAFT_65809 [Zasmidium cellare ATCC 36951]KAF2167674.1 hypothetical protein M409DRAFT_65809 [Zasmidium cellare ATCC 36951]
MLRPRCLWQKTSSLYKRQFSYNVIQRSTAAATATEAEVHDGDKPLQGKFVALKANIATKTNVVPTTAASKTLANYHSPFHATVSSLLLQHGASLLPNANMDEFGMGSHSQFSPLLGPLTSAFSRNGKPLSPGGSSGGSALWVANELCWAAIGTDTGGSVRLPGAYCGVVGFKPSYGRISRWGVVQYANSLDTVGVLAKEVQRAREVFQCLDQEDWRDMTCMGPSLRSRIAKTSRQHDRKSLRIGIPLEYNIAELSPPVKATYTATLRALHASGHTLHPVSLPTTRLALSAYYILAPAEASSNLAKYDGIRYGHRTPTTDAAPNADPPLPLYAQTRAEAFGPEVQRRILLGAYTLSSDAMENYFLQAQRVRRLVQRDFDRVFAAGNPLLDPGSGSGEKVDVLLTPTAPTLPPTVEELEGQSPVESYMNDVFTVPASLAGLPAISVPVPLSAEQRKGMDEKDVTSVGMQLIGQFGNDKLVLDAAEMLESINNTA